MLELGNGRPFLHLHLSLIRSTNRHKKTTERENHPREHRGGWLEVGTVTGLAQGGRAWPAPVYPVPVTGMSRWQRFQSRQGECQGLLSGAATHPAWVCLSFPAC